MKSKTSFCSTGSSSALHCAKSGIRWALCLSVCSLLLCATLPAAANIIGFEGLTSGAVLFNQYASEGVLFRDQLSASGNAPSAVVDNVGGSLGNVLKSTDSAKPIYILLSQPARNFNFTKWEPPIPTQQPVEEPTTEAPTESAPTEEYTVYWDFYKLQDGTYIKVGSGMNSDKDAWVSQSFSLPEDISAIGIYGDIANNNPYYLDNIEVVPELTSPLAALAVLLASFAFARKK